MELMNQKTAVSNKSDEARDYSIRYGRFSGSLAAIQVNSVSLNCWTGIYTPVNTANCPDGTDEPENYNK